MSCLILCNIYSEKTPIGNFIYSFIKKLPYFQKKILINIQPKLRKSACVYADDKLPQIRGLFEKFC